MKNYFVVGLLLLATIAQGGCILEPRKAETPASGAEQWPWIQPNRPRDVFANLTSGLASDHDSNYERSLDGTFTFTPSPDAEAIYPGQFADWTKQTELDVLKNIKLDYTGTRTVQFGDSNLTFEKENEQGGVATFEGNYTITLSVTGDSSEVYAGYALFTLIYGSQGWVMQSWEDIRAIGPNPTSGILRGRLRS